MTLEHTNTLKTITPSETELVEHFQWLLRRHSAISGQKKVKSNILRLQLQFADISVQNYSYHNKDNVNMVLNFQ